MTDASKKPPALRLEPAEVFRLVMESSNDLLMTIDPSGRLLFINRVLEGFTEDEVHLRPVFDFLDPASHGAVRAAIAETLRTGKPTSYEAGGQGAGGKPTWYLTRVLPLPWEGGEPRLALVAMDISALRAKDAALAEKDEQLRLAHTATGMGLWTWTPATEALELDEGMEAILGVTPEQRPRTTAEYARHVHPDDRQSMQRAATELREQHRVETTEYRVLRPGGEVRWVLARAAALRDPSGKLRKVVGMALDVTDRHLAEDMLRQAQRAEILGQLSASVAHNFNNLLMAILPNLELAQHHPDRAATHIAAARRGAEGAARLVHELLSFAGTNEAPTRTALHLGPLLDEVLSLARGSFPANTTIALRVLDTPPVVASAGQLQQVLLNLLINARDAMHEVAAPRLEVVLDTVRRPDGAERVRVRVRDNGAGIPADVQPRLFVPFFTTKPPGKGTGLGLLSALGIVRDHGGTLTFSSTVGQGTEFCVELPAARGASPERAAPAEPAPTGAPHRTRVLLVDDNANVLRSTALVLEAHGFHVVPTDDGAAALGLFRAAPDTFDVVMSDTSMPGMSGPELLSKVRALRDDVCLLLFSGLPEEELGAADGCILKPIDGTALAARVEAFRAQRAAARGGPGKKS